MAVEVEAFVGFGWYSGCFMKSLSSSESTTYSSSSEMGRGGASGEGGERRRAFPLFFVVWVAELGMGPFDLLSDPCTEMILFGVNVG